MDYLKALETAIIYIENHLHDKLRVEDVARYTGYSYLSSDKAGFCSFRGKCRQLYQKTAAVGCRKAASLYRPQNH